MSPMMGQNIFGGILLSFIFFILINKISVYFGLNSPLLPILITTLIIGISLKRKIVDEVFPLIGIGFYLLIGWMILYTDMLYGTYAEEYGWVLLFVSVMAFVIWIVYFITIKILQKLLNQAKQRIGEIVVHLFVIGGIIYNIYRLYRLKKNLLFGLTGGAAISVHLFLHIHNIEYLPLELTTFMIASFVALLPFYTRNIQKKSQEVREMVDVRSSIRSIQQRLSKLPRPWQGLSIPSFSVPQVNPKRRLRNIPRPSLQKLSSPQPWQRASFPNLSVPEVNLKQRLPNMPSPSLSKPSINSPSWRSKPKKLYNRCRSGLGAGITKITDGATYPIRRLKQTLPVLSDKESQ